MCCVLLQKKATRKEDRLKRQPIKPYSAVRRKQNVGGAGKEVSGSSSRFRSMQKYAQASNDTHSRALADSYSRTWDHTPSTSRISVEHDEDLLSMHIDFPSNPVQYQRASAPPHVARTVVMYPHGREDASGCNMSIERQRRKKKKTKILPFRGGAVSSQIKKIDCALFA